MKILKIFLITLALFTTLLVTGYFFVVHNIKSILIHQLTQEHKSKYDLSITTFDLSLSKNRLFIKDLHLSVKDSSLTQKKFDLKIKTLELTLESTLKLILRKQLNVDRLVCEMPEIKIKPNKNNNPNKKLNLTAELAKLFKHIKQTIKDLNVDHFEITNGGIALLTTYKKTEPTTLTDLNLKVEGLNLNKKDKELLSEEVHFYCRNQRFYTPDSNMLISFKKIEISNKDNRFEIDSLFINGHRYIKDSIEYNYQMAQLKIVNIDFNAMYNEDIFKCDSLLLINPEIKLAIKKNSTPSPQNKELILSKIESYKSNEMDLKNILGNLNIKHIRLLNSKINFNSQSTKNNLSINTTKTTIKIDSLIVNEKPTTPIHVGDVYISIKDYQRYSKDSLYHAKFDAIKIKRNSFELINYSLTPSIKNTKNNKLWLTTDRLAFTDVAYDELIYNSTIKAKEIILDKPKVRYNQDNEKKSHKKNTALKKEAILSIINDKINIEDIRIINGDFLIKNNTKNSYSEANSINTLISLKHIENITNPEVYKEHLYFLSIGSIKHTDPENRLAINDFSFSKESNQFNIKKLNLNNHTINIQTKNVSILEPALSNKKIIVKNIATESIDLSLNKSNEQKTSSKKKVSLPNFIIENIDLKNVSFALTDQASKLKVNLDFIKIQSLSHDSASYSFNNFNIKGHSLIYKKTNTSLILESFDLYKNNLSTLTNFQFTQAQNQDTLNISLPIIKEQIKWDELLKTKKLDIESFELNEPKIYYSKNNTIVNNANTVHKDPLDVTLKNLTIKNACVDICINQKNKKQQLHFPNINLKLKNVHQNTALDIQQIDISFNNWHLNSNQKLSIESSIHESSIQLSNVKHTKDSTQFTINDMQIFTNKIASINNGKETSLKNLALSVQNQKIKLPISNTIISNILDNKTFEIKHTNTSIETEDGEFFLHRMGFNNHQFTIDSISYIPKENEEKFNEKQAYQKDYIIVTTKKIKLNQIDIEKLYNKNELTIGEINIDELSLYSYRDKRKPVMPYKYKALPTALINKITFPFDIKSISLTNAKILYKETSEKSELTGSIHFTDLNATITHITNIHTNPMDSLHMVAQTKLIGKSPVALKFTQSYKDTLSGFELNIQTGALDLTQLNQATEPLAGIKINSGHLESLKLHALGNDLYAIGKIEMPYKNLNITLSQHSDTTSANALGKVASLLANKLVVRTNNTKEGVVFFERIQNKSIFNFWFKLTMSGIMSSVGVKNSNRVIRHYNHYLKKNNLSKPEIDI